MPDFRDARVRRAVIALAEGDQVTPAEELFLVLAALGQLTSILVRNECVMSTLRERLDRLESRVAGIRQELDKVKACC